MTIIVENFADIALMPDDVSVLFCGIPLRPNSDGTGVITRREVTVRTVNGVMSSPALDPGPCRVRVSAQRWNKTYDVMIPESGTHRLFELEEIIIAEHKVIVKGDKGDIGDGVNLSGSVPTYADLGPGPWDLGTAFVVNTDGLLYIYGTAGWPDVGAGAAFRGDRGLSVNSVAISGNQLQFGLEDSTALPKVTVPALVQAASDAAAAAVSRGAADSAKVDSVAAKDATLVAKGQVDAARADTVAAKAAVDVTAAAVVADRQAVLTARDATLAAKVQAEEFSSTASAQAGAASASAAASGGFATASLAQADRAFAEADRAEAAADEIATGSVADNAISTVKVQDGAVTKLKLGTSVQASLDRADSAVQGSDGRLVDARTPTAHTHSIGNVTGLQTALDGKAAATHTHTTAQVTGLDAALAAKGTSNLALGSTSTTALRGDAQQYGTVLPGSGAFVGAVFHVTEA
ncbi:phage tail repeat domain-containing protein [Rhodococcus sp. ARC_M6]|uniref:phage tail repeat domain-containing protein n=1 Tax=Rhodococcus sp. ARC_M6 TaxID=2928852 RepID=UPI001FB3EF21|nr:phage tail repeat domain-containing protein [Rhodococcus sp. ARC_M6]MCJ0906214.1 phage tail repeat domain-containing protein [Rhodococcus sp. ARC_M6]